MNKAISYIRISTKTNLQGDGFNRQSTEIESYAKKEGIEVVANFQDVISGTVPVEAREGFAQLIEYGIANGVTTILIASYDRFSRDLMVSEYGYKKLTGMGFSIVPVNAPAHFTESKPENVLIRQMISSIAEYEKSSLVRKLRVARERKKIETGRCEGRLPYSITSPELVRHSKRLHRLNPRTKSRRSFAQIARELHKLGFTNTKGEILSRSVVRVVILQ